MKNKKDFQKKKAMTLAEILVVITIVAIIGGIFLAMPRKNISKTDRTKYYIAYNILQRLINEQLVDENSIALNLQSTVNIDGTEYKYDTFGESVDKWLNVAATCSWNEDAFGKTKCTKSTFNKSTSTNAILTNGMYLDWSSNSSLDKIDETTGEMTQKGVYFDIDGVDEGKQNELKDIHYFVIYKDGNRVKPAQKNNTATEYNNSGWIGFKVYKIGNNSKINVILLNAHYDSAYGCFADINDSCQHKCSQKDCFMEPVQPMKL